MIANIEQNDKTVSTGKKVSMLSRFFTTNVPVIFFATFINIYTKTHQIMVQ